MQAGHRVSSFGMDGAAFSVPGGERDAAGARRPVDLAHLAQQTMGDRDLERDVLDLFVNQALGVRDRIGGATVTERLFLMHGLKGSARAVGAFAVAGCADEIANSPDDPALHDRLAGLIGEVCDFVATIGR